MKTFFFFPAVYSRPYVYPGPATGTHGGTGRSLGYLAVRPEFASAYKYAKTTKKTFTYSRINYAKGKKMAWPASASCLGRRTISIGDGLFQLNYSIKCRNEFARPPWGLEVMTLVPLLRLLPSEGDERRAPPLASPQS